MDNQKVAELLQATLAPGNKGAAEDQLKQIERTPGFAPSLLKIVMSEGLLDGARQAGVIYLKNFLTSHWSEPEPEEDEPTRFTMDEKDRAFVRDNLIDAVVLAPHKLRGQLLASVRRICRHDFPVRWPSLVPKLSSYLQSTDAHWPGGISAVLELAKAFEIRKGKDRAALNTAMIQLMPYLQHIMEKLHVLIRDRTTQHLELAMMMQRLILKVFFNLSRHFLPLPLLGTNGQWERFRGWMLITLNILERSNPQMEKKPSNEVETHLLENSQWWKSKKWSLRILNKTLKKYGDPKHDRVPKNYKKFCQHYVNTYPNTILDAVFKIITAYHNGNFVEEKVLYEAIRYLKTAIDHGPSWERMKSHVNDLLKFFIFPLMCHCHTAEDERLWKEEPVEYINKYEETAYSVTCGEQLLNDLCEKEEFLSTFPLIIIQLFNDPKATTSPHWMDGVLHMVGAVADTLLKSDHFKEQLEDVLMRHIFSCMEGPHPFLRARAAWVISKLSMLRLHGDEVLPKVVNGLVTALLKKDEHLPVKVQAVFSIEDLVLDQHRSHQYFQPYVVPLCQEVLEVLHKTENDGVTSALRKILRAFPTELAAFANEMCAHLARTFDNVMKGAVGDDKTNIATGLIKTMEAILEVMEKKHPEVCLQLEPVLLTVIALIFQKSMKDFYENAFSIISTLTEKRITPSMWQVFDGLLSLVNRDGIEYFIEVLPAFHNYITVDTPAFLGQPSRLIAIYDLTQKVLSDSFVKIEEDSVAYAVKLIEVLILQCRHQIQNVIPKLLELVMGRLSRPMESFKLRSMCHQVLLASLYHDINLTLVSVPACDVLYQWIANPDCFDGIHDKKICVLGLCALMNSKVRPPALQQQSKEIIPLFVSLFNGLKNLRENEAKQSDNTDTDYDEEEDDDEEVSELDQLDYSCGTDDDADVDAMMTAETPARKSLGISTFSSTQNIMEDEEAEDDEDNDESSDEDGFEGYTTPLDDDKCPDDEYIIFKDVFTNVQKTDPGWYAELTSGLTEEQRKSIQEVIAFADDRKSKQILNQGGFNFQLPQQGQ